MDISSPLEATQLGEPPNTSNLVFCSRVENTPPLTTQEMLGLQS
jgi:hypothetical protein